MDDDVTTIAAAVFDVIKEQERPCTTTEVCELIRYEPATVISAMHRLSEMNVLTVRRIVGQGIVYSITPGAQRPDDRRGRPKKK